MLNFKNKKFLIPAGIVLLAIAIFFISKLFRKPDDWAYSYNPAVKQFLPSILSFAIPLIILAGIIFGIVYAIRKRKTGTIISLIVVVVLIIGIGLGLIRGVLSPATSSLEDSLGKVDLGFSVGGAKDINSFRSNIEHNYIPQQTDITYEGLFYDYYFDTGEKDVCEYLFCPSYSYALSKDPLSKEDEYYLQVGLNSNLKAEDFQRKKLNLVVVLDISGSMGSGFNKYYYDAPSNLNETDEDATKSKMEIASIAVNGLLDHLNDDDRFGMILFDGSAYLGKPISLVGKTDMEAIKNHVDDLRPRGSTNMDAGYTKGTSLFDKYLDVDQEVYENRIIFLTDAMPNRGAITEEGLFGMTKKNADNKISTTFIGIGVDFNTELIESITKIRGANYYAVHSSHDFKTRMDDEFEYMVTPLVFDLTLQLFSPSFEIEKVYGSPEANEATGEIMRVNTLFPSKTIDGETKGGIVILKLKKTGYDEKLVLTTYYKDRSGDSFETAIPFTIPPVDANYYDNNGIRKGIVLSRYVNIMRNWIDDERESHKTTLEVTPRMNYDVGIVDAKNISSSSLNRWEQRSVSLSVSSPYKEMLRDFNIYFKEEMDEIGDQSMMREVAIMNKLLQSKSIGD